MSIVVPAAVDTTDPDALEELLEDHGHASVDLALIDAPCSGLGTLRRNPELRTRTEAELPTLVKLQHELLDAVAPRVRWSATATVAKPCSPASMCCEPMGAAKGTSFTLCATRRQPRPATC